MIGLLLALALVMPLAAQGDEEGGDDTVTEDPQEQFEGNPELALPPFPDGVEWVNVERPLTVEDLRGKIVIFDFWTYGCINCIHMIPVLNQLEEKYSEELVVIGVHSAKFETEGETQNIEQVVQRYGVAHPVINDKDFTVWQTFGVNAWPTFVVVDPRGNVLAAQSGEIPFEPFDALINGMVDYWDDKGELDRTPLDTSPEGAGQPARALSFPGKVLVDGAGERLFIADTSNHRIVIADLNTYTVQDVIGTGHAGYVQGSFDEAQFNQPQGMALHDGKLFIADTGNHTVHVADLESREVDVLAGTGERSDGSVPLTPGMQIREPRAFQLRSPWDVTVGADNTLFIANAGSHQIYEMNLETRVLRLSVGNGREAMLNRALDTSELAQPSGLYFYDGMLYFADSESSTIRVADYTNNAVMTISGTMENDLFDFGDVDGPVGTSRLQHPLGITGNDEGDVYIADTYNNRIKLVDGNMETYTLYGDGTTQFDEPGGLDYHDGKLYVADTNNHAVRVVELATDAVRTVTFPNPERLQIAEQLTVVGESQNADGTLSLPEQRLAPGEAEITLTINLPDAYKINTEAPSRARFQAGGPLSFPDGNSNMAINETTVRVPLSLQAGEGRLQGEVEIYYCEAENESLCFVDTFTVEAPLVVRAGQGYGSAVSIQRDITPPQLDGTGGIG